MNARLQLRPIIFGIVLGATFLSPDARADFGQYARHELVGSSLRVYTNLGELRITAIDDAALEVHYLEEGVKQLPSFALAGDAPPTKIDVNETGDSLDLTIDGLSAIISKSPVRISYSRSGRKLVAEEHGYFARETVRGFRFQLNADEKILGGGQRVLGMDRRGQRMPLYNRAHYGYTTESSQMYYSLPAIMSSRKYVIVFDNSASGNLDIGSSEESVLQFDAVGGRTAYLIMAADSYPDLIDNYTQVTGRQPLPPRWAFGNFASRFGYRTEQQVRDTVRKFREEEMPLDAVILDLYWFGPDIKGHVGNLDWDRQAFPTAEKMIRDFAKQGVRTIPITEPFILTTSTTWQDAVDNKALANNLDGTPKRFDFYFGNSGLVDVFNQDAQQWFWAAYQRLFEQGVAGTWGDLGEPEAHPGDTIHWLSEAGISATGDEIHNAYGHMWAKMVYDHQVKHYPEQRPVIMMRSGFAGSQRFGMIPWTGDVDRSWAGLQPQVELSLQMSLFGLAYTHSDLGGFAGGKKFDQELYIRWLQYGVFQPVYRPHGQDHIASEPVFHNKKTRDIVREYIKLRYRLLPYNYTLAYRNTLTGMPLMRPLFFEDESDTGLIDIKDSYLWGDAFLVKPVTESNVKTVDVRLPEGVWFDFWNDLRHSGGKTVRVPVTIKTIPVLVRAGSFIPMTGDIATTRDYSSAQLALHYYADESVPDATGMMYEDDGVTRGNLVNEHYELLHFSARQERQSLTLNLDREAFVYRGMPSSRAMTVVIHHWVSDVSNVQIGEHAVPVLARRSQLQSHPAAAFFDADTKQLTLRFDWDHTSMQIRINNGGTR